MTDKNNIQETVNLVLKVKAGDTKAMDLLMQRYLQRVLRIVRLRLGAKMRSKMESMDVVQEVMIRAIKGIENFELKDEATFLHWISKLVQNQISTLAAYHGAGKRDGALEVSSDRKNNSESQRSVLGNIAADSIYRPSVPLQLKEDVLRLEEAMEKLPEKQRELIVMRQYEGFSFGEIGEKLGITEDASRMQYARALSKLSGLMIE